MDYDQGDNDNEEVTVLPKDLFTYAIRIEPVMPGQDWEHIKEWKAEFNLQRINGVWYKEGKRTITDPMEGRRKLIQENHDPPTNGHPGILWTIQGVERLYWWLNMREEIKEYVKGCMECQQSKNNNKQKAALHPIFPESKLPFGTISIDFITKLPESRGYNTIMTIVDHDCTKMATFIPCKEGMTSEEVAALYLWKVFP